MSRDKIAVIIPCYNEALTIGKVIDDFRRELPEASVYVYDNNSTDGTAAIARSRGAVVRLEPRQGKGNVCRQMFRDIEADCYLMVDGDDTYPAEAAKALCEPILAKQADMVVGDRLSNGTYAQQNARAFHGFGNDLVRFMIKWIYGYAYPDVMTGYRAMSKSFIKTFPVLSEGFQIETELSIHAVDHRWRILNIPIDYRDRPEGSVSKLNTVSDGLKVIAMIGTLFKDYRPLKFFSLIALAFCIGGLCAGMPVVSEHLAMIAHTGLYREGEYVDQLLTFHQLDFSNAHAVTEKFSFEGRPESNEFIGDLDQLFHDPNSLVSSSDIIDIIENGPVEGVSDGGAPYHEHTRLSDKAELAKSACSKIAESEQREPGIEKPTQIEAK